MVLVNTGSSALLGRDDTHICAAGDIASFLSQEFQRSSTVTQDQGGSLGQVFMPFFGYSVGQMNLHRKKVSTTERFTYFYKG